MIVIADTGPIISFSVIDKKGRYFTIPLLNSILTVNYEQPL
jgi:hypothetical protein